MSVPTKITTALAALQTQIDAASPLSSASFATLKAIEINSQQLETDTAAALQTAAGLLDTWVAPRPVDLIVAGVQAAVVSTRDEWRLCDMLFVISRANLNVSLLLGGAP
jgi:hypothetical protein